MKSKKELREEFKAQAREAERQNFNSNLKLAKKNADDLVRATIVAKQIIINELSGNLKVLWDLRHLRNDDWIDILNHLQIILRTHDEINTEKAAGIQQVVDLLLLPNLTEADVERALDILVKCGFDPWVIR